MYIDAGLGAQCLSQASLLQVWSNRPFSTAPGGRPVVPPPDLGDLHSAAVIELVGTPKLLGSEFRFISSLHGTRRG